jgi:hypothetical protein
VVTGKPTESQNQLQSVKSQVNLKLQYFSITAMSLYSLFFLVKILIIFCAFDCSQISEALAEDPELLKDIADPAIRGTFAVDSLSTVAEIALNCTAGVSGDRPSIDDVLWNLQYSMQVQDGWASSESLSMSIKSQA